MREVPTGPENQTFLIFSFVALLGLCLTLSPEAHATPLRLDYAIANLGGGVYGYHFTLTLDNHDTTWVSGNNFNFVVFGDCALGSGGCSSSTGRLSGWSGDLSDLPVGPFTNYGPTEGSHNGPTLFQWAPSPSDAGWIPSKLGDSLSWSGTSTAFLGQGTLLFSNLLTSGSSTSGIADFEVANLQAVPEPSSLLLLGSGLAGLGAIARRRNRQA